MLASWFSNLHFSMESSVFAIGALIVLLGAFNVVIRENPIHSALSLVATLFGVAVLYVVQQAYFLAAMQVIVYAGAIVILFMFVIMLLGVDQFELLFPDRRPWRRPLTYLAGALLAGFIAVGWLGKFFTTTGKAAQSGALARSDVHGIGQVLFTRYLWAFEVTGVLLTVAVVGAVVLARRPAGDAIDLDEFGDTLDPWDESFFTGEFDELDDDDEDESDQDESVEVGS